MEDKAIKRDINWPKVLWYIHLNVLGIFGVYTMLFVVHWLTMFFAIFIVAVATVGVTVGAHRLWAHQTFEAPSTVRLFLMVAHTLAGVGPIYDWVLKHRLHHKYYGSEIDLYNHKKGFLYCHVLSNCMIDDPVIAKYERDIDMRDVDTDGFVWIQRRFYWPLFLILGLLLPVNTPAEYWDESIMNSVFVLVFMRLAITLHVSWLVNSAMLIWGLKPGDKLMSFMETLSLLYKLFFKMPKSHGTVVIDGKGLHTIYPADDNTVFILHKSYWPNYHYLLPWDWKSGEFGTYDSGFGTLVIKMLRDMGLISLLKSPTRETIQEALYKVASNQNVTIDDAMEEVEKVADLQAKKERLYYTH